MRHPKVSSWEAKCAALERAFRKLPIRQAKGVGIPYEFFIPGIPRQLMLMRPLSLNSRRKTAGAKKRLARLAKSTGSTIKALEGLSQTALATLNYQPTALKRLTRKSTDIARLRGNGSQRKDGNQRHRRQAEARATLPS